MKEKGGFGERDDEIEKEAGKEDDFSSLNRIFCIEYLKQVL